jgi:hypothetical protein
MSHRHWGKITKGLTGRQVFMRAQLSKNGMAASAAKRFGKILTVSVVVSSYNNAIAAGESEDQAIAEAAAEVFNITPISVREMVAEYRNNSDWEYVWQKSFDAYTAGPTLLNGFSDDSRFTRGYWYKEFLQSKGKIVIESECKNEE